MCQSKQSSPNSTHCDASTGAYSDKKDATKQVDCPDQLDPGKMQDMELMPSARCRETASADGRKKKWTARKMPGLALSPRDAWCRCRRPRAWRSFLGRSRSQPGTRVILFADRGFVGLTGEGQKLARAPHLPCSNWPARIRFGRGSAWPVLRACQFWVFPQPSLQSTSKDQSGSYVTFS